MGADLRALKAAGSTSISSVTNSTASGMLVDLDEMAMHLHQPNRWKRRGVSRKVAHTHTHTHTHTNTKPAKDTILSSSAVVHSQVLMVPNHE